MLPVGMRSEFDFARAMNVHCILMHPGYITESDSTAFLKFILWLQ